MEINGAKECSKKVLSVLLGEYLERKASCKDMKNRRGWVGYLAENPDGLIYMRTGESGEVRLREKYTITVFHKSANGFIEAELEIELYADDIDESKSQRKPNSCTLLPKLKSTRDDIIRFSFAELDKLNGKRAMFLD